MSSPERPDDSNSTDDSGKTDDLIRVPGSAAGERSSLKDGSANEADASLAGEGAHDSVATPPNLVTPVASTESTSSPTAVEPPEPGLESTEVRFTDQPSLDLVHSPGVSTGSRLRVTCACVHVTTIVLWFALAGWSIRATLSLPFYIFFSLTTYHSAAFGLWLGIGRPWWRWIVVPCATMTLVIGSSWRTSPTYWEYALYCFGIVVSTACLVFLLRLSGKRLVNLATGDFANDSLRFGIRHLIVWTCGVAVLLGLLRGFGTQVDIAETWRNSRDTVEQIVRLVFTTCLPAAVSLWVWLGHRLSVRKFLLLCSLVGMAMYVSYEPEIAIFPVAVMISQGIFTFLFVLYRLRGFRLINVDRMQKEQSEVWMEQG